MAGQNLRTIYLEKRMAMGSDKKNEPKAENIAVNAVPTGRGNSHRIEEAREQEEKICGVMGIGATVVNLLVLVLVYIFSTA
ncbi:hypothetical protein AAFF_G00038110 [Aldrovandia affinis]|uniref:Uncharacterized protein n=1 Tax=Aldrovandia affinis TaxID=143900 RepID=A0AAD7T577_9TELE|nr:hypothetical protein AAFF_G00038110 [Aldrovandia affinis]